jgi:hypothetical protein
VNLCSDVGGLSCTVQHHPQFASALRCVILRSAAGVSVSHSARKIHGAVNGVESPRKAVARQGGRKQSNAQVL